jgi:ribonucleoside-diphosphate reductase alpha chain
LSTIDDLLRARYYHTGEHTWSDLCHRVANNIMDVNWLKTALFNSMNAKQFLPSTPVLANAGSKKPMLCSCFVIPVEDSITGIMQSLTDTMMIQKYGGGVGIDFSPIRADNSIVTSTGGKASGPVSFMGFWNEGMNVIKQGGKRQGALMGVLNVNHPDLLRFIQAKEVEGRLTNFNISVALDHKFFENVALCSGYVYPCGKNAGEILGILAHNTWRNGEPGVIFLDNINANNPYNVEITTVNPCGEQPLPPYGACCLGSINLNHALKPGKQGGLMSLDKDKLRELVSMGVLALNEILNKTWWPLQKIADFEQQWRPIGLGVMGLADALAKMGIPYRGGGFVKDLFKLIREYAEDAAHHYATETGKPMNATVLSIAPTGSIAMLADASYGIEPYFSLAYTKKVAAGEFKCKVNVLDEVLESQEIGWSNENQRELEATGSVQNTWLPDEIKYLFRTAQEISPAEHLQVQADVQASVDSAISKTINLPSSTTEQEIADIIVKAHSLGIKGLTMYRARSREVEVMECPTGSCSI